MVPQVRIFVQYLEKSIDYLEIYL